MQVDITLDSFLSKVAARNTNSDGTLIEPSLMRRFDNPICRKCHATYKEKYPGQDFSIKCSGIYDERDYVEKQQELQDIFPEDEPVPIESPTDPDIREVYDVVYWAHKHIRTKDDDGHYVPFVARDYQVESLRCTAAQKVDRWARGLGKAELLSNPIPTLNGWTTMAELKVGDYVFTEQGKPTRVLSKTDIMHDRECYEVAFSDGSSVRVDGDHLWLTWDHKARSAESRKWRLTGKLAHVRPSPTAKVRTTKEIKETLLCGNGRRVEHNHSVLVCKPVEYEYKDLLIPPYTLGVWLGDGSSTKNNITCHTNDKDIRDNILKDGYQVNKLQQKYSYSVGTGQGFHYLLKQLNLIGNKHVPHEYLLGSVEQRLALLQGLMDTDGTITPEGYCRFDNTNKLLTDAVYELVCSLGMVAYKKQRVGKLYGEEKKICYRVQFSPTMPVFRLVRKSNRIRKINRTSLNHRYITSVKQIPSEPVQCITVESPTHLYLTSGSFITTHNSSSGVIEELHKLVQTPELDTLVVCPADTQSNSWYENFLADIDNSPTLRGVVSDRKQNPYRMIKFNNGSVVRIATAGSSSGRKATNLRGLDPRRVRIDEQDYLVEADWGAISPLLTRHANSEFHGSSTPTGDRSKYWEMCTKDPRYREFYNPITVHPNWSEEMETACRADARTEDRYRFEFLAEFGDPTQGVFKNMYVDAARVKYVDITRPGLKGYDTCRYDPTKQYFMGVDWNGKGTGTKIRVVEYDPKTKKIRVVGAYTVDHEGFTAFDSIDAVEKYNKQWHCTKVFVDAGFGGPQFDMLRLRGVNSQDSDTRKLRDVVTIDFGGKLSFNNIIPSRDNRTTRYLDDEETNRRTKPYLVEGAVMYFEQFLIEFSDTDKLLEDQLRSYRVATYTKGGQADTYKADANVGDHDLDAFMLALLAVETSYGIYATADRSKRLAQVSFTSAFGLPGTSDAVQTVEDKKVVAGIPSRTHTKSDSAESLRIAYLSRGSMVTVPGSRTPSRSISRTSVFGNRTPPPRGGNRGR